jgi:hypothetical protein
MSRLRRLRDDLNCSEHLRAAAAVICDAMRIGVKMSPVTPCRRPAHFLNPSSFQKKIVQFLEERANAAFVGTRNRDLVPFGHRVSGWSVGDGGRTLTAFIPEPLTTELVVSLQ